MKIQYMSDLHLEFGYMPCPPVVGDVLVLAGDVHLGNKGISWINDCSKNFKHVIYILGNHEYYRNDIATLADKIKNEGLLLYSDDGSDNYEFLSENVHFLDNDYIDVDGYRFIGTTLWSDITESVANRMNDFNLIQNATRKFSGEDARQLHKESKEFINSSLSDNLNNIVITHHCPHIDCINTKRYGENDPISAGYYTDILSEFKGKNIAAWISGHTHNTWDFVSNDIRVVGNCRGYIGYEEVEGFNPESFIEV